MKLLQSLFWVFFINHTTICAPTDQSIFQLSQDLDFNVHDYIQDFQLEFEPSLTNQQDSIGDDAGLVVSTEEGSVRGYITQKWNRVRQFQGIPYAKPPIGDLRFEKPQGATPWHPKVLVAKRPSPQCLQPLPVIQSEDCLYLNVYTPVIQRFGVNKKFPVMLWIHGGGFQTGSGPMMGIQSPHYLVHHRDIVVVSINYRLGALGFMVGEDFDGNFGLYDQILAMQWIQDNIENFGGDKTRVTLWGESAGAMSIGFHLVSPQIKPGMFHRVIMESNILGYSYKTVAEAKPNGIKVCKLVGCKTCNKACLKNKGALNIVFLRFPLIRSNRRHLMAQILNWTPVIDGNLVIGQPIELIELGKSAPVPVILGYNTGEAGLAFAVLDIFLGMPLGRSQPLITRSLYKLVINTIFKKETTSKILELYPPSSDANENIEKLIEITGDFLAICPGLRASRALSQRVDTRFYIFNFTATILPSWFLRRCREKHVCHAMELPYVFHSLQDWPMLKKFSKEEHTVSHAFVDFFVKFAYGSMQGDGRTGMRFSFGHDNGIDAGHDYNVPEWTRFEYQKSTNSYNYLHFAPTGKAEVTREDYRTAFCEFWDTYKV